MILVLLILQFVLAGEPDDMMARVMSPNAPLANDAINKAVNDALQSNITAYNRRSNGICNPRNLDSHLRDSFDKNWADVTNDVEEKAPLAGYRHSWNAPYKSPKGDACKKALSPTVPYNVFSYSNSMRIKAKGKIFYIGADKLDHFFPHGFTYWLMMNRNLELPAEKLQQVLDIGIEQENGVWGLSCWSVKSYADLAANYKGIEFWKNLFDGENPFITCKNGRYELRRRFNVEDFFDESMDESINCSSYPSDKVLKPLKDVWNKNGISCPAVPDSCVTLAKSYPPEIAKKILHPRCLGTGTSQIETPRSISMEELKEAMITLVTNKPPEYKALERTESSQTEGTK